MRPRRGGSRGNSKRRSRASRSRRSASCIARSSVGRMPLSVKLRGHRLQDHPDLCSRIVGRSHLKDLEFKIEKPNSAGGFPDRSLVRLAWERDHLVVMTGALGDEIDGTLHQQLVRMTRDAAIRPLTDGLFRRYEELWNARKKWMSMPTPRASSPIQMATAKTTGPAAFPPAQTTRRRRNRKGR